MNSTFKSPVVMPIVFGKGIFSTHHFRIGKHWHKALALETGQGRDSSQFQNRRCNVNGADNMGCDLTSSNLFWITDNEGGTDSGNMNARLAMRKWASIITDHKYESILIKPLYAKFVEDHSDVFVKTAHLVVIQCQILANP